MGSRASSIDAQVRAWRTLRGLHPEPIDLARIRVIRESACADLLRPTYLESLLLELGLNDEGIDEFPAELHRFCGHGLRVWQYPCQFSKYLAKVAPLGVASYLELGIRHGGSFVATVEILERFRPLDFAVGVDIIRCPAMTDYGAINPHARFACLNTQSAAFAALLERLQSVDLVFIDSHHEESQCRREVAVLSDRANMIALHDVSNVGCPGIGKVWQEVKASDAYACYEFTQQYHGAGPYMGIGLAIKRERLALAEEQARHGVDR